MPQVYYFWATENGNVEEPSHWAYQPEGFCALPSAQPAPNLSVDLITDYLVSISAHVAHQEEPQAQAEIRELLRMLAAAPCAQPAPSVPEGWPTEEMTTAFARVFNSRDQYGTFPQAFRAALAAAPEPKRYVLTKVVQYHQLAKMEKERDTLRTHLDFAKDELNKLRADIEIMKQQSNLSIPDPMDIFTDQDLLKVAEAWREFDAPSGADEFGRRIYGSIRSALNAYRDRLITLRRMEIIPTDLS